MKFSSGRLGQYMLLNTDENLSKHLPETKLFTEETFFFFLKKYKKVLIKPVFGPGEISVYNENNKFDVTSNTTFKTFTDRDEVFQYLIDFEIKQKYNVIQPKKRSSANRLDHFQYFVTVHRCSSTNKWILKTKTSNSLLGSFLFMIIFQKIKSISIQVARKLGETFSNCNTIVIEIVYNFKEGIWIHDTILHLPISKWSQHHSLTSKKSLRSFVPNTDLLTKKTLSTYLKKYKDVVIKPCLGQHGKGLVQITSTNNQSYEIHSGRKKVLKLNIAETVKYIEEYFSFKKYYLVQQKLPLVTIDGNPMDIRVVAQKLESDWIVTGKIVKLAARDFFITNASQKLLSLENALLQSTLADRDIDRLETEINKITLSAARRLEEDNEKITIIGFDIGITSLGGIWIIEGNYIPDLSMFRSLEDKEVYWNILKMNRKNR